MRFTLQEILWDSEFGVNYLALEKGQESSVVVRKLSTELDHRQQERWKREWQILQKMRHRGIPQMIEMTTYEFEGRRYPILIHEYAKGEQLRRRHDNRPLSQTQSMLICGDLLKIVSHLQTVNPAVIHRNISPDSI
ncbi:MAG: protein kinase, partial [Myxococcota bacterium]|nr:protein kinase [Myxococcota bacterium]